MRRGVLGLILVVGAFGVVGCAQSSPNPASPRRERAATAPAAEAAPGPSTPAKLGVADGKSLGKVRQGMTFEEVVAILGPPSAQRSQLTAHAFNPFAVGNQGQVTRFYYQKVGRVVFAGPDYAGGGTSVIAIEADPNESGRPVE